MHSGRQVCTVGGGAGGYAACVAPSQIGGVEAVGTRGRSGARARVSQRPKARCYHGARLPHAPNAPDAAAKLTWWPGRAGIAAVAVSGAPSAEALPLLPFSVTPRCLAKTMLSTRCMPCRGPATGTQPLRAARQAQSVSGTCFLGWRRRKRTPRRRWRPWRCCCCCCCCERSGSGSKVTRPAVGRRPASDADLACGTGAPLLAVAMDSELAAARAAQAARWAAAQAAGAQARAAAPHGLQGPLRVLTLRSYAGARRAGRAACRRQQQAQGGRCAREARPQAHRKNGCAFSARSRRRGRRRCCSCS